MAIVDYYVDDGFSGLSYEQPDIKSKKRYAYTTSSIANTTTPLETMSFSYTNANWKDQLTAVNGKPITYDNIGNPTQYGANTDSDKITFEWEKGRQLKKIVKTDETVEFKYNENGLRIQKVLNPDTANAVVTNYTLHGKNIVHMTQGGNNLHFFYDASNKPAIVEFNGTKYAYVHNLQGDIVAILDSNGTAVVQYKYDAWGKPISKTGSMKDSLGKLNPFRYRGYVYDEETGLYYLRSRYYVSSHSRFLNMDSVLSCASFRFGNSYTYCGNSPVRNTDQSGAGWFDSVCSWCEDALNSACSWTSEVAYPALVNTGNQLLDFANKALGTVYVIFDSASAEIACGVGISRSTGTLIDVGIDFSWSTTISYNLFDHFSSAQKLAYSFGLSYNGSTQKNQNIGPAWGYNGSYVHEYNDPLCSCKYNSQIFSIDCPAAHVEEDTGIDWVVGIPLRIGPFFWCANAIYDIDGVCDRINRIWTSEDTVYKICFEE